MYTLLVSHQASERDAGEIILDGTRFLEYTDDNVSKQLRGLSNQAIACILAWPCLLMDEGRGEETAYLRQIVTVRRLHRDIVLTLQAVHGAPRLTNDDLWRLRAALDIGEFEFSRNHLAIKSRDVLAVLRDAGYELEESTNFAFTARQLPALPRADLIRSRDILGALGHTELDDLLLEAGIDQLLAGRAVGSRRDRANAIVKFAIENPEVVTAENDLLGPFLLRRAGLRVEDTYAPVAPRNTAVAAAHPPASATAATKVRAAPPATAPAASPAEAPAASPLPAPRTGVAEANSARSPNRVFIVHGRDEAALGSVVDFLQSVGLIGIVLHEQPNMGRHLLTKFIDEAELVTFAVVLMTGDDVGGRVGEAELRSRARQNVILELGYFMAHLGQPRVCALVSPGLETPSDFDGIVYLSMSPDGRWRDELLRELRAAEMPVAP